jgi:hypothetical protein
MSTIKADNFTWKSGESSGRPSFTVTADNIISGTAKSWSNFYGGYSSTFGTNATFNVSSIVQNSTGNYTSNFTTAMKDAFYSFTLSGRYANGEYGMQFGMQAVATTYINVSQYYTNGIAYNCQYFCITINR